MPLKCAGRLIYGKIVVPASGGIRQRLRRHSPTPQEASANASGGIRQRLKRHPPLLMMGILCLRDAEEAQNVRVCNPQPREPHCKRVKKSLRNLNNPPIIRLGFKKNFTTGGLSPKKEYLCRPLNLVQFIYSQTIKYSYHD
jgi:hypothetical protein